MKFSDFIPNPINVLKGPLEAPFKKREGQPWLQATARNFGHAAFGDKIGNYVDQNYLGDIPQQAPETMLPAQPSPSGFATLGKPAATKPSLPQQGMQAMLAMMLKQRMGG